jgi:hypothetical protein
MFSNTLPNYRISLKVYLMPWLNSWWAYFPHEEIRQKYGKQKGQLQDMERDLTEN